MTKLKNFSSDKTEKLNSGKTKKSSLDWLLYVLDKSVHFTPYQNPGGQAKPYGHKKKIIFVFLPGNNFLCPSKKGKVKHSYVKILFLDLVVPFVT